MSARRCERPYGRARHSLSPALFAVLLPMVGALPAGGQQMRPDGTPGDEVRAAAPLSYPYSFAVLGHIRGTADHRLNYLLDRMVTEVQDLNPDFVVLTGDVIWGDVSAGTTDPADVTAQWNAVDAVLGRIGVPIYRVPGNHDINDTTTHRIYRERYGAVHRTVDLGAARLILFGSGFLPEAGETRKNRFIGGLQPDSVRVSWIREQLAQPVDSSAPTFFFMHHLLWWAEPDSSWWTQVHPLLAQRGVRAVFSGDYGPMKFSHLQRDGVDYYQTAIAPEPAVLDLLRSHEWNRLLASQFDNFLLVRVRDPRTVEVEVHTLGETESGDFTPDLWRAVHGGIQRPGAPGGRERVAALWNYPKGRALLIGLPVVALLAGIGLGAGIPALRRRLRRS